MGAWLATSSIAAGPANKLGVPHCSERITPRDAQTDTTRVDESVDDGRRHHTDQQEQLGEKRDAKSEVMGNRNRSANAVLPSSPRLPRNIRNATDCGTAINPVGVELNIQPHIASPSAENPDRGECRSHEADDVARVVGKLGTANGDAGQRGANQRKVRNMFEFLSGFGGESDHRDFWASTGQGARRKFYFGPIRRVQAIRHKSPGKSE